MATSEIGDRACSEAVAAVVGRVAPRGVVRHEHGVDVHVLLLTVTAALSAAAVVASRRLLQARLELVRSAASTWLTLHQSLQSDKFRVRVTDVVGLVLHLLMPNKFAYCFS